VHGGLRTGCSTIPQPVAGHPRQCREPQNAKERFTGFASLDSSLSSRAAFAALLTLARGSTPLASIGYRRSRTRKAR